jgi:hypothetical protein
MAAVSFGKPPRPPVKAEGKKSSQAKSIRDDGETRGVAAKAAKLKGRVAGRGVGSTGKGPPPSNQPPKRLKTPMGPGMAPGIAGPAAALAPLLGLAIGQRPTLGARTKAAMRRGKA